MSDVITRERTVKDTAQWICDDTGEIVEAVKVEHIEGVVPSSDLACATAHVRELEGQLSAAWDEAPRGEVETTLADTVRTLRIRAVQGEHRATAVERERDEAREALASRDRLLDGAQTRIDILRAKLGEAQTIVDIARGWWVARQSGIDVQEWDRQLLAAVAPKPVPAIDAISAPAPGAVEQSRRFADAPCGTCCYDSEHDCLHADGTGEVGCPAYRAAVDPSAPKPETCGECATLSFRNVCLTDPHHGEVRGTADPACDKATRRLPVVARGCITCLHNATGSQACCDCDESDSGWTPRPAAQEVKP